MWASIAAVHPHVCGDNATPSTRTGTRDGSPPRVWGQLGGGYPERKALRFTPTCVGTTLIATGAGSVYSVHPHVCGDNGERFDHCVKGCGSPPRVWGQRIKPDNMLWHVRFTPTCVGTTDRRQSPTANPAVHPHVCGDNRREEQDDDDLDGSPPRVWGQRSRIRSEFRGIRFTPTCVGTTGMEGMEPLCKTVHPHVCGDNFREILLCWSIFGSPPRVWGQRPAGRR